MALLDSEIQRIRAELGYPVLSISAEPYIGFTAVFQQVIKPYTEAGASTTSSSTVVVATVPTPTSLVLASATGFAAGAVAIVDVDARQERATISAISGATITVQLTKAHVGTFPVTIEGGESLIRDHLTQLRLLSEGMNGQAGTIAAIRSRVGLKKVEDVEFFGGGSTLASQGLDPLKQILELREYWRDELAALLGIPRLNKQGGGGGASVSMY